MELRRYGTATILYFPLIDKGATDFESTPVTIATGDCKISKNGGAFANTNSNFAHLAGGIYSLSLTDTEMQAKNIVIKIVDQTGTKEWEDQAIIIDTCGDASAEIPNLADASVSAVKAKTDNLPSDPADASDIASSFSTVNTKLDAIDDYVDTEVSAIKAKTDLIPASPASVGDIPTVEDILTASAASFEAGAPVNSIIGVILKLTSRFVAATGSTYKTNGTDVFMTQTPTADPSADPIIELGAAS